ncbi:MAG: putative hydrolase [Gammaproteobacteria bacterium]|nr:putative hydrolase [Gammaproteobacteria bacterium]
MNRPAQPRAPGYRTVLWVAALAAASLPGVLEAQAGTAEFASAAQEIASQADRLPAWMARSTREFTAMRDGSVPGPDFTALFAKTVARIPARDGAELYTEIYAPLHQTAALPMILVRSPYGLSPDKFGYSAWLREYTHLMKDGYIFVFQDARGRGASTGRYVTAGPIHDPAKPKGTDDSTDAYDTIDWMVKHVPHNNGRVGILGISYGGFLTTRALVNPHPALKAASPQATCVDMFIGDDFHHNGAFRLQYAFEWIAYMETGVPISAVLNRYDQYDRFLELGPLSKINETILHGKAPSWNAFDEHPNFDSFWSKDMCGVLTNIQSPVKVPTLNVGGWFDAEDHYGAVEAYKKYERGDVHGLNNLVMGPWYHGGWTLSHGRTLGPVDFGSDTANWYREHIEAPWFAHWLKGKDQVPLPEVASFRTGVNEWKQYDSWPPKADIKETALYFHAGGLLSFDPPTDTADVFDEYVSDPAKPVPYVPRPITDNGWPEWQTADQRFVDGRPDVLTYQTAPLEADVTVTGEPMAHLLAATTGSDADWVVKLIDVYPDMTEPKYLGGYEFMVAEEVFRARYRNSFEKPEAVIPGQITPYEFSLRSRDHTFKAGHRIMVQVQSTWFPLIDRNPQTYVPNIYEAVQSDFRVATQSIYRSSAHPSLLKLPLNSK